MVWLPRHVTTLNQPWFLAFWVHGMPPKFLNDPWVMTDVPMGHITQPLGIWSIMATFSGDVQYSQNGTFNDPIWSFGGFDYENWKHRCDFGLLTFLSIRACSADQGMTTLLGRLWSPSKSRISFFDSTTLLSYGLSKIHVHHQIVSNYNILHHNTFDGSIPSHQAKWAHATHATRENERPCAAPPSRQRTRPWRKRGASQDALCSLLGSVVSIPNMNV